MRIDAFLAGGPPHQDKCAIIRSIVGSDGALELISDRKREMIRRLVPRLLVPCVEDFAGVSGTRVYGSLRTGAIQYVSAVLQKPASSPES